MRKEHKSTGNAAPFRGPQKMADILGELMAKKGFARIRSTGALHEAWNKAVGEAISPLTSPGPIRRGVLEVTVANSILVQELGFQKSALLKKLTASLPEEKIRDFRLRVGVVHP